MNLEVQKHMTGEDDVCHLTLTFSECTEDMIQIFEPQTQELLPHFFITDLNAYEAAHNSIPTESAEALQAWIDSKPAAAYMTRGYERNSTPIEKLGEGQYQYTGYFVHSIVTKACLINLDWLVNQGGSEGNVTREYAIMRSLRSLQEQED
jgi:hypothetical protein